MRSKIEVRYTLRVENKNTHIMRLKGSRKLVLKKNIERTSTSISTLKKKSINSFHLKNFRISSSMNFILGY